MPATASATIPPVVVIFGDEDYAKSVARQQLLDRLVPPDTDRAMAIVEYDGTRSEEQGGPSLAAVADDLNTLPMFADRRIVIVSEADKFITTYREQLEAYCDRPASRAALVLVCRTFPKTTRLYKAIQKRGGELIECKRLSGQMLTAFVMQTARAHGKRLADGVAERLVDLIGPEQGLLATELEKLALFVGDRPEIDHDAVRDLSGQSREERIFAVMDAAATGDPRQTLHLWRQTIETDPGAVFKVVGGIAFVLRKWLSAHELRSSGMNTRAIAPKVMMWGRERQLEQLLQRLPATRIARLLGDLADLDAQSKSGSRSIETGVEALLLAVAAPE